MIGKDRMMDVFLDACPSFAPRWKEFLTEWQRESEDLPLYLVLGDLARHLCVLLARNDTESLRRVFHAVEQLLRDGDKYVREAVIIGLLEDLQNPNLHSGTRAEKFIPFLGPEATGSWAELEQFWSGNG